MSLEELSSWLWCTHQPMKTIISPKNPICTRIRLFCFERLCRENGIRLMSVSSRTSSSHSQKELKKSEKLKESIASHTNQKQDDWYQRHLIRVQIKIIVFTGWCVYTDWPGITYYSHCWSCTLLASVLILFANHVCFDMQSSPRVSQRVKEWSEFVVTDTT